ncbi:MAG: hypothetical protein ACEQSX_04040 [Baekduiaceae bacterium]
MRLAVPILAVAAILAIPSGATAAPAPCTITGTPGDDVLVGTDAPAEDVICGLGGNDTAYGIGGDDVLRGGPGNDTLYGGAGDDDLVGEGGDDTLDGQLGADLLDGGDGLDTALYASRSAPVAVTLNPGSPADGEIGEGDQVNTEHATGGSGDDRLTGSGKANVLIGGPGNDRLLGGDGKDSLYGGSGNDLLDGQGFKELMACGPGGADRWVGPSEPAWTVQGCEIEARTVGIDAGSAHTCYVYGSGSPGCWGDDGIATPAYPPVYLGDIAKVRAGDRFTCALEHGGAVWCSGRNTFGQLGDGTTTSRNRDVRVVGIDDAVDLATGTNHACAVRRTGEVLCWGSNDFGELGADPGEAGTVSTAPVTVGSIDDATQVTAGYAFTCAVRDDGTGSCWGLAHAGQLGDGRWSDDAPNPVPGRISGLTGITSLSAGERHACAVADGGTWCWGEDAEGALGDGDPFTGQRPTPALVPSVTGATDVTAGGDHSCARTAAGDVWCWGRDVRGQLGDGTAGQERVPPTQALISDVAVLDAGAAHTCAIDAQQRILCWGDNSARQVTFSGAPFIPTPTVVLGGP